METTRTLNGYILVYDPSHPKAMTSANWGGWVYEHIQIAEIMMGRPLRETEEVHHLDFNRENNRFDNLLVLEKSQHTKLHNWLSAGALGAPGVLKAVRCRKCDTPLQKGQTSFCSKVCAGLASSKRKVERPSEGQLKEDMDSMSWLAIGRKYGVSDNAARKWARSYGLM